MRIMHVCLSCFYIDGFNYQENMLVREHVQAGHEVKVLASTENYIGGKLAYVKPAKYLGSDGAEVIRLPYRRFLPHKLMTKLRMHSGVYEEIAKFSPDVLMFHGLCGWELRTVCRYKKANPNVRLWVDSHEDHNNSASSFIAKLLHKLFYKPIINSVEKSLDLVLCVSLDTIEFVNEMYGVPKGKLIFYPLGAKVYDDEIYLSNREEIRERYSIRSNEILIIQTGKQTLRKKLLSSLEAFSRIKSDKLKFFIAGTLSEEVEKDCLRLINNDSRIYFLGWQAASDLERLLCASDVYLQPGTQSATMQASLGARCAVILDDVLSHQPYIKDNGWLINQESNLENILKQVEQLNANELHAMQNQSFSIAKELLNYKNLALFLLK
ncbi:MAG: glycosyltransferase family 4 protein [Pseudomonadaceae bacterium]|nr:glycosyltransferase family 4 protein [Pseudomonadaceae bacterium]